MVLFWSVIFFFSLNRNYLVGKLEISNFEFNNQPGPIDFMPSMLDAWPLYCHYRLKKQNTKSIL